MAGDGGRFVAAIALLGGALALVVGTRRARAQVDRGWAATTPSSLPHSTSFVPTAPSSLPAWLTPVARVVDRQPDAGTWVRAMAPGCAARGIQPAYAARWVEMESGWNPCAIGYPAARGPDGLPKEMGIAQFYNPDDLAALGLTGAELRAYCVPGDQHPTIYKHKKILGFSQAMSRGMTPAEIQRQADAAVGLIAHSMASATRDLAAVGAGPAWSPRHRSYWAAVKLQHGLPQVSRLGLPAVTKLLGRPPADWAEFRRGIDRIKLDPRTERDYREYVPAIMENAERCADAFTEEPTA